MSVTTTLLGRRAVYTCVRSIWDKAQNKHVDVSRELFHGTIVALTMSGERPVIVLLYDDGSLRYHNLETITVEGAPAGFRDAPEGQC